METLNYCTSPQLRLVHSGKVRDSFKIDAEKRLIIVSDRISCFDKILETPIPNKGAVLNGIASYWFEKTAHICRNHYIESVDPSAMLVREAKPIRIEVIVRGYLTGSAWRSYEQGRRVFFKTNLPDGLSQNCRLSCPIVTPTTKEESDREIQPEEITSCGLTDMDTWTKIERTALDLFAEGTRLLADRNLILVDTKYEFGMIEDELLLIDEMHTPDSSRFWYADSYLADPVRTRSLDKEFIRQWLLNNKRDGEILRVLPEDIICDARDRYLEIYRAITGHPLDIPVGHPKIRLCRNLANRKIMKDAYVAIVMGSLADREHADKIAGILEKYDVMIDMRVISAHKNGERIIEAASEYNNSLEPGVVIAVAGKSNGLGGALAANLNIPVINCPPFKDWCDFQLNINSSLMMPSQVPAMTVVNPESAALAALKCLNLYRLRERRSDEILAMKRTLYEADQQIRNGRPCDA